MAAAAKVSFIFNAEAQMSAASIERTLAGAGAARGRAFAQLAAWRACLASSCYGAWSPRRSIPPNFHAYVSTFGN